MPERTGSGEKNPLKRHSTWESILALPGVAVEAFGTPDQPPWRALSSVLEPREGRETYRARSS